jgi:hypothetical protein
MCQLARGVWELEFQISHLVSLEAKQVYIYTYIHINMANLETRYTYTYEYKSQI